MSKTVLVVDDNAHDREIYGKLLWYNGFEVALAEDGENALEMVGRVRPDLVVLDMRLPGRDGLDVCRELKNAPETAGIPVIALSARPELEMGRPATRAGCATYLEKPIAPVEVLYEVERLIGRSSVKPVGEAVEVERPG